MWKVVIIDDDKNVLQGMKTVIPWEELELEWAGEALNGEEGLELIKSVQPDIIITDIYMPIMNGLEMVEYVQAEPSGYCGKIIILSGYSDFEYARKALRLGIVDYLNKPITVKSIRSVLENVIQQLDEELKQKNKHIELEQRLKLYEPFVEKEWLKSVTIAAASSQLTNLSMIPPAYQHWDKQQHIVLGVEIIPTERLTVSSKDLSLFRFAVSNIINEVCQEHVEDFAYVELFSNHLAIILHFAKSDKDKEIEQRLRLLARQISSNVEQYLQVNIQIGLGLLKQSWQKIADSTEEAFQAINTKLYKPEQDIPLYIYTHCARSEVSEITYQLRPIHFYQQISEAIKSFNEEKCSKIIDDFCTELSENEAIVAKHYVQLGDEVWMILAYALFEVNVQLEEIIDEQKAKAKLRYVNTCKQLEAWLSEQMKEICIYKQNIDVDNVKHKRVIDYLVGYIHEHYNEQITITDLADQIFISRNYLSYLFKKAMGESFNSYLTRVRMEKAKEMILEGKMLIYEIAEHVGYKNVPYFSSQFKKYTGKKPTELYKL